MALLQGKRPKGGGWEQGKDQHSPCHLGMQRSLLTEANSVSCVQMALCSVKHHHYHVQKDMTWTEMT